MQLSNIQNWVQNNCKSLPSLTTLNQCGNKVETVYNAVDCLPFVGIASGSIRAAAGKIQLLFGLIFIGVGAAGGLLATDRQVKRRFEAIFLIGQEHALHGALNFIRGVGTVLSSAALFGVGNLVFLLPNLLNREPFTPHFKYGTFTRHVPRLVPQGIFSRP